MTTTSEVPSDPTSAPLIGLTTLAICIGITVFASFLERHAGRPGNGGVRSVLHWWSGLRFSGKLRAGCVPLRIDPGGRLKLLLIRSRKHPEWFTFPAGGVERGETLEQSAARETLEEAGLSGRLGKRVAEVQDAKSKTVMFSMHVHAELSEWDENGRERRWFDLGVPGTPSSQAALEVVRAALSPKPVHQQVLDQIVGLGPELAKETEMAELASRECGAAAVQRK